MYKHALVPASGTAVVGDVRSGVPTYGELIDQAEHHLAQAVATAHEAPAADDDVYAELDGFRHLLHVSRTHLVFLNALASKQSLAVRRLAQRLTAVTSPTATVGNEWGRAADALGAAHDLLSTHLDRGGQPRSLEGDTIRSEGLGAAERRVVELMLAAVGTGPDLVHRIARGQRRSGDRRFDQREFERVRRSCRTLTTYGAAAMWDLTQQDGTDMSSLDDLAPAGLPMATPSRSFASAVNALRVLRRLSFGQARGQVNASPASLRGIALLGAHETQPQVFSSAASPLERVRAAHAVDQLNVANALWTGLAERLTTQVQGVTKAPASYAAALDALENPSPNARFRHSLLASLPSLGRCAADTIHRLSEQGSLVSRQPVYCQPRKAWRPLTAEETADLIWDFRQASTATQQASVMLDQLGARPTPAVATPRPDRSVDQRQMLPRADR